MSDKYWFPWYVRKKFRIPVARLKWSDWAGAGYEFSKTDSGSVVYFWTRAGAQDYADKLNESDETEK